MRDTGRKPLSKCASPGMVVLGSGSLPQLGNFDSSEAGKLSPDVYLPAERGSVKRAEVEAALGVTVEW